MVRRRLVFAGSLLGVAIAAGVACSLDENGVMSVDASLDVQTSDASIDVPQSCATLDATACVDAALPDGWSYAVVAATDQPCPAGDYQKTNYLYKPSLQPGACDCTCITSGSYSCAGQVGATSGGGCSGKAVSFDAGDDASCIETDWNDPHISVDPLPSAPGSAACATFLVGDGGWNSSTSTVCTPGCTVDYCGASDPFRRCILNTTNQTCPAPFTTPMPAMATNSQIVTWCKDCQCALNEAGACTATVLGAASTDCSNPYDAAVAADGSCATPGNGGHISSFLYVPQPPEPTCSVTDGGLGAATFTSAVTVCCLP